MLAIKENDRKVNESSMDLLEDFEKLSTGNVADALAKLGMHNQAITNLHPLSPACKRTCGRAITIKQKYKQCGSNGTTKQRQVFTTMVEPGNTVVIDALACTTACTGGGLLLKEAKRRGLKGVVVNGCLRDLEEIIEADIPVNLIGGCPVASKGILETEYINEPVKIDDVVIAPGDLVLQDLTGCVVIPSAKAWEVLAVAQGICIQEEACEKYMDDGLTFAEARQRGIDENPIVI